MDGLLNGLYFILRYNNKDVIGTIQTILPTYYLGNFWSQLYTLYL